MKCALLLSLMFFFTYDEMRAVEDSISVKKHTLIKGILISPFTGFSIGPRFPVPQSVYSKGYINPTFSTASVGLSYNLKMNLIDFNSESCLAINAPLNVVFGGFINTNVGVGTIQLNIPLMLSYDCGAGSTFVAEKEKGYSLAFGGEATFTPVFINNDVESPAGIFLAPYVNKMYILPVIMYSQRKWAKNSGFLNNKAFKFGMLPYSYTDLTDNSKHSSLIISASFSFGWFYNY